eukprot:1956313-Alexandrium_andersonii.AAC.1
MPASPARLRRPDAHVGSERGPAGRTDCLPTLRRAVPAGPGVPGAPQHHPLQQGAGPPFGPRGTAISARPPGTP